MNTHISSSFLRMPSARILAGLAVFCILLNGLVPRFSIQARDYAVLSRIIKTQSILLQFFSFSSIPSRIVGELMGNAALPQREHKGSQSQNSANTSTDFSIRSGELKPTDSRQAGLVQPCDAGVMPGISSAIHFAVERLGSPVAPPAGGMLCLLLLLCLLPRSNIDDNAILAFAKHCCARFAVLNRVFYFYITTSDGSAL